MYKIEVESYCSGCLDFEADVELPDEDRYNTMSDTVIRCKNKERCDRISRHIYLRLRDKLQNGADTMTDFRRTH